MNVEQHNGGAEVRNLENLLEELKFPLVHSKGQLRDIQTEKMSEDKTEPYAVWTHSQDGNQEQRTHPQHQCSLGLNATAATT